MSTQPVAYLKLRVPERRSLWLGAICACIIPVGIGIGILWPYFEYVTSDCISKGASDQCYKYRHKEFDLYFHSPIALTFIFGTPLVAWLSCKRVIEEIDAKSLHMYGICNIAMINASKVHLWAAITHLSILSLHSSGAIIALSIMGSALFNIVLCIAITIPLSILCSNIFRLTALTKSETDKE